MNGIDCRFIIGDLPQVKRLKVIDDVKAGKIKVLVATDVAARGLDIENLSMVINYDLPVESENYVHRIGRTARAGKSGKAITLASEQDVYELPAIERYIGKKIPCEIATRELYDDDKSAGQQIHTEYNTFSSEEHRQRHHAKGVHTKNTRGSAVKSSGATAGKKHDNRRRKRKEKDFHETVKSNDLSALSMEERMSHYKRKYAGVEQKNVKSHQSKQKIEKTEEQKPEETAKKNILSKFIGLFRKK
jgi:ATP-dependent RNA helicase RhlB